MESLTVLTVTTNMEENETASGDLQQGSEVMKAPAVSVYSLPTVSEGAATNVSESFETHVSHGVTAKSTEITAPDVSKSTVVNMAEGIERTTSKPIAPAATVDTTPPTDGKTVDSPDGSEVSKEGSKPGGSPGGSPVDSGRVRLESITIDAAVVNKKDFLQDKEPAIIEEESLTSPIQLLPGELMRRLGRNGVGGVIMLTTFRLFMTYSKSFVNIPLRLIESVSCVGVDSISVTCKDGTVRSCKLASSEACFRWLHAIKQELASKQSFIDHFAVAFSITASESRYPPWTLKSENPYKLGDELERMGFDLKSNWRITNINENYKLCNSYPKENVVPKDFPEELLERAAPFRARCRFPSVVWRNKDTGTVLVRSSQPELGFFCQRSEEDEKLTEAIVKNCETSLEDAEVPAEETTSKRLLVADARSYSAALANRAKGGGMEYAEYYTQCDIEFMALPNIHSVRTSFAAVRNLVSSTRTNAQSWYSSLESSSWITNLSTLISSAKRVVEALATKPVLVHCSDGWDRTPQICSLAQLIIDPYYRTFKGFQVLISKEWLSFGHKFAQRCGHALGDADSSEVSPIFLQWLDAVYQLTCQFPTAFEFNEACLIKLVQHTYSCMFGTFLCDSEGKRVEQEFDSETVEVWSLLDALQPQLSNILYNPHVHKVLDVSSHPGDLTLWTSVYSPQTSQASLSEAPLEESRRLRRSRSYTDISNSTEANLHMVPVVRTLSDPDLSSSLHISDDSPSNLQTSVAVSTGSAGGDGIGASEATSIPGANGEVATGTSPNLAAFLHGTRSRNNSGASSSNDLTASKKDGDKGVILYDRYLDIDGLAYHVDPKREKVVEITNCYEKQIAQLKKQIKSLQRKPPQLEPAKCSNCHGLPISKFQTDENAPSSAESNDSDSSWETVSTRESNVQKWMPDYTRTNCCLCNARFTLIKRKHHCRQCGEIFCDFCAAEFVPIPDQQLFDPVRVCRPCHEDLILAANRRNEPTNHAAAEILRDALDEPAEPKHGHGGGDINGRAQLDSVARCSTPLPVISTRNRNSGSSSSRGSFSVGSTSAHTPSPRKTCSQESLNTENSLDGKQLMGARV